MDGPVVNKKAHAQAASQNSLRGADNWGRAMFIALWLLFGLTLGGPRYFARPRDDYNQFHGLTPVSLPQFFGDPA
jgi:hypothetical protein